MKWKSFLILLAGITAISSCKKDEYVYPNVLTEFVDITTSSTGRLSYINCDNGESYQIKDRSGIEGFIPDTTYRAISVYEPEIEKNKNNNNAKLYSCQFIVSPVPVPEDKFNKEIKTDPVDIDRIWLSGNYINMILDIMAKDKSHGICFILNGISDTKNGYKTINMTVYHNNNDDYEAYTKKAYASIPLWPYNDILNKGDKIIIRINTYKEGMTVREFEY